MNSVMMAGLNHQTINACIFLASLDWQITLLASDTKIDELLANYRFDKQVLMLWQWYCHEGSICLSSEALHQTNADYYWLFLDNLDTDELDKMHASPTSQFILTGVGAIGSIFNVALQIKSAWVYYLPFIFMKEGANFNSFFHIDLLLIGEKTRHSVNKSPILAYFIHHSQKQHLSDIKTVEFARVAITGMLATRLSYINELARLADAEGVDIHTIEAMMGADRRIGQDYLKAGWGFGGQSLPSELGHLMTAFNDNQLDVALVQAVQDINSDQKELIFRKFWQYFNGFIDGKTVMIWGAGYRTGAGLSTNSAVHPLLALLWSYGITTKVYAVFTKEELARRYSDEIKDGKMVLVDDPYALGGCDGLFIINWNSQEIPNWRRLNEFGLPIFDGKNILGDEAVANLAGFYTGIGR